MSSHTGVGDVDEVNDTGNVGFGRAASTGSTVLETALLDVRPGHEREFEAAFQEAERIIASMPGYLGHELMRCIEVEAATCCSCARLHRKTLRDRGRDQSAGSC